MFIKQKICVCIKQFKDISGILFDRRKKKVILQIIKKKAQCMKDLKENFEFKISHSQRNDFLHAFYIRKIIVERNFVDAP